MKIKGMRRLAVLLSAVLALSAFAFAAPVASADGPVNIRVGVLSDVHITGDSNSDDRTQVEWFEEALTWYRKTGVDAIIIAGDTIQGYTDTPAESEAQFKQFVDAWYAIFPNDINPDTGEKVERIFIYGNHDAELQSAEATGHYWKKYFGEDYSGVYTKTVKGYKFVCAHWGEEGNIETQIKAAVQASGNKPVFYVQHPHPGGTCYGSESWSDGNASTRILKNYPSVVAFSGHSHFPLTDERSIWQGTFTSIGTASMHYVEMENGKVGGSVPADAHDMKQGMYMTVTDNKVNIERINFFQTAAQGKKAGTDDWVTIGKDWVLDLPLTTATFKYTTEARTAAAVAPAFASGAKITVSKVTKNYATISFPAAILDSDTDMIHSYLVEAVNKSTGKVDKSYLYFSEFYLGKERMGSSYEKTLNNLTPETDYTLKVYALECFQKKSAPISVDITTQKDLSTTQDVLSPDVLDVNFLDGTAKDDGIYDTQIELKGNAKVEKDAEINKYVLKLDGDGSYANCWLTAEQYSAMKEQMTMEVVFKANATDSNQAIVECTQSNGMGFEITGDGKVELWIAINGSYYSLAGGKLSVAMNDNEYHHIVATFNKEARTMTMYLDGEQVAQGTTPANGKLTFNNDVAYALGADAQPAGEGQIFFNGNIALARLYSHSVDDESVKTLLANAESTSTLMTLYRVSHGSLKVYSDDKLENEITDLSTIKESDTVYVVATPDEGYIQKFLTVNGKAYTSGDAITMDGQKIVKVLFGTEEPEESGSTSEGGSTSGTTSGGDTSKKPGNGSAPNTNTGAAGLAGAASALALAGLTAVAAFCFRKKED